ncbi:hypothetical protein RBU61_07655 [Tissierella sp. MB52-C2]|uniref:hypothetical protein n=1 Tax=Tissierella sp. MB52-C2 TaxID=3070999 RepID=UPI00280BF688|nr:hypothetical protein [Tissierella sp. MB52-C2]WMM26539.1 hypothetical protein RBU61_07655 [Tissierella sp. MB52-C2]
MDNSRLYEAIFIFDEYCEPYKKQDNTNAYSFSSSLSENIFNATLRLLAAHNLIMYEDSGYYATDENLLKIKNLKFKMK